MNNTFVSGAHFTQLGQQWHFLHSGDFFFPGLLKADGNQEINLIIIIWFLEEEGLAECAPRCGTEAARGAFYVLQQHQRPQE